MNNGNILIPCHLTIMQNGATGSERSKHQEHRSGSRCISDNEHKRILLSWMKYNVKEDAFITLLNNIMKREIESCN